MNNLEARIVENGQNCGSFPVEIKRSKSPLFPKSHGKTITKVPSFVFISIMFFA